MIGKFTLAMLSVLLGLLLTTHQPRPSPSACEHRLAQFVPVPFEGKGSIPPDQYFAPEPITADEVAQTQDRRLFP